MPRFKRGDRVLVVERETTAADRKAGVYYPHFRGLHGVVDQIYEEEGEICVEVDPESLQPAFLHRHQTIENQVRQKWLNGLSDQERRSLPEEHKQLRLKYTIMISPNDLVPEPGGRRRQTGDAAKPAAEAAQAAPSAAPGGSRPSGARRVSEADLDAAEEAYIEQMRRKAERP